MSALILAYFAYGWWSQPPVVSYDNLRYVELLMTAVSSRNSAQVTKVESVIAERHRTGALSDIELDPLQEIIAKARAEDWEQAHRQCFALAEAQQGRRRPRDERP
ncbi:hypothetical protein [Caulifigura coniformis]|nr:hypothetical protein [Caulifigura coniformis]